MTAVMRRCSSTRPRGGAASIWRPLVLTLFMFCPTVDAIAQTLGEVAAREEERLSRVRAGRIYTNDDLSPAGGPVPVSAPASAPESSTTEKVIPGGSASPALVRDSAPAQPSAGKDGAPTRVKARNKRDETYWRQRAQELRGRLQTLQDNAGAIEARTAALEATGSGESARELAVSTATLARLRRDVSYLQREVAYFEQRARSENIPADWIR